MPKRAIEAPGSFAACYTSLITEPAVRLKESLKKYSGLPGPTMDFQCFPTKGF